MALQDFNSWLMSQNIAQDEFGDTDYESWAKRNGIDWDQLTRAGWSGTAIDPTTNNLYFGAPTAGGWNQLFNPGGENSNISQAQLDQLLANNGVDFNGQRYLSTGDIRSGEQTPVDGSSGSWSDTLGSLITGGLGPALFAAPFAAGAAGLLGGAAAGGAGAGASPWVSGFDLAGGGALGEAAGAGAVGAGSGAGWTSGFDLAGGGDIAGSALGIPSSVGASSLPAAAGSALTQSTQGGGNTTFGIPNNVLSGILQGGLGLYGANLQSDALENVYNQQSAIGAPFRDQLQASYQPGFDLFSQPGYGDAFNRAADVSARSWSARAGNPAGNPTAQAGIQSDVWNGSYLPALSNYRGQLGQFGGMGLNTASQASLMNASNAGSGLDALAFGANTALNPLPDWAKIFQQYGSGSGNPFQLNIGGNAWGRKP